MAEITFKIDNRTAAASSPGYKEDSGSIIKQVFGYENAEVYEPQEDESDSGNIEMKEGKSSLIGHPIFMPLQLEQVQYDVLINGKKKEGGITVPKLLIPLVILEASRAKVIATTSVEGRNGTIKEFSNLGDYDISIKGVFVGDDGQYPEKQVKALADFENCPVSIGVTNPFFTYINVTRIVIKKINWKSTEGYQNIQAFELDCLSDEEISTTVETKG